MSKKASQGGKKTYHCPPKVCPQPADFKPLEGYGALLQQEVRKAWVHRMTVGCYQIRGKGKK